MAVTVDNSWPNNTRRNGARRKVLLAGLFVIALVAIGFLASTVRQQLQDLETATSDNVQWNLSQLEVEYLAFVLEVEKASVNPSKRLDDLRKRFDVLYSRISTLSSGALYAVFRDDPETGKNLTQLRDFVERSVPLIDSPDETLRNNLRELERDSLAKRQNARSIALQGIKYFSDQRDLQRRSVYETLVAIAVLTIVLLVALLVLVFFLSKLNRQNQARALENELRESRMSAIVTTSLDAIVAVNRKGVVVDFNGAAEEIFGYSRDEAIGAAMADLIIPDHLRQAHDAGMKRYLETGEHRVVGKGRVRLEGKRKNGEVFPVEFSIAEARGEESEIFISYLRDISKEVSAEDELKTARDAAIAGEKSKSRFLAVMSHEMRTPLNGLLGTMELLGDTNLTSQQKRFLQIMEKSGAQLLAHVNDVLDISRLESGKTEFDKSIFDVQSMLEELVQGQTASAQANKNELRFTPTEQQILVETDQVRLRQVMLNLVGNAIKFTRNGSITVETESLPDGKTLELRVIDTGMGIPEDRIEQIFEDFTTLDSSFGRRTDGTGLGLGIAQRITEALGGKMGVESELGEGSLFWTRLPILVPDHAAHTAKAQSSQRDLPKETPLSTPMKILLVEDNQINREVARSFLESDNHVVVEAQDGKEGVELANWDEFDAILMDISMPEMDGIEATRAIRSGDGRSRNAPIIALTAHTQQEDVDNFLAAGMNEAVFKPITRQVLRKMLNSLSADKLAVRSLSKQNTSTSERVDHATLSQFRSDIGEEKFPMLLSKFIAETDAEIDALCNKTEAHDLAELAARAHRLSGSAAIFGTTALWKDLKDIESQAKTQQYTELKGLCVTVEQTWADTRADLQRHV